MNRQGVLTLWPIRLPGEDGRIDHWSKSAMQAADRGSKQWVRVTANMSLGAYEMFTSEANIPEPNWPDLTLKQMLHIAFKDYMIKDMDHPVLKRLRGEA